MLSAEVNLQAKWKKSKSLKPKVILDKIDSLVTVSNGTTSYSSFEFHDAKTALESMINFPLVARYLDKNKLISSAIREVANNKPSDPRIFIDQISTNIREVLEKRNNQYFLLTSISISNIGIRFIKLNDCVIKFYKSSFPRKFKGRDSLIKNKRNCSEIESLGYTKVVIELSAKSEEMAAAQALRILDLFRSMLNLFSNNISEYIGNEWNPINKIRLGEFHTVHDSTGKVYADMFWFDPSYSVASVYVSNNIPIILKNVKFIITNLEKSGRRYKSILTDGLLRYVRSFDENNQNVAVMRAWGALETIAAPNETNCDSVTRRCSFLYEEHEYHKQILEHLREYRNRNVHAGEESKKAKNHGFQIQRYFKGLLLFHISNVGYFSDIEEANKFLDLPADKSSLLKRQKLLKRAFSFRGYDA